MSTAAFWLVALLGSGAAGGPSPRPVASPVPAEPPSVVFVCEHGSVKSLVAALHFQRLAQQRGLAVRASSRGTQPDDAVPAAVARALAADGFDAAGFRPRALRAEELRAAWRTVALGVDLTALGEGARVARWDDIPPVSVDYAAARAALLRRLEALLEEFERDHARAR